MGNVPEKNVTGAVSFDAQDLKSCGASRSSEEGDISAEAFAAPAGVGVGGGGGQGLSCESYEIDSMDCPVNNSLRFGITMTDDGTNFSSLNGDPDSETVAAVNPHVSPTGGGALPTYDEAETSGHPPDLQGLQLDEDLNPDSLPFESLNSNFQFSVMVDSDSDEDDEEDSSSMASPSDLDVLGSSKLQLDLPDAQDFLSTEAENQLEGCDKWSLGSSSFEFRTLDKRRRSSDAREESDLKLPMWPENIPERSCDQTEKLRRAVSSHASEMGTLLPDVAVGIEADSANSGIPDTNVKDTNGNPSIQDTGVEENIGNSGILDTLVEDTTANLGIQDTKIEDTISTGGNPESNSTSHAEESSGNNKFTPEMSEKSCSDASPASFSCTSSADKNINCQTECTAADQAANIEKNSCEFDKNNGDVGITATSCCACAESARCAHSYDDGVENKDLLDAVSPEGGKNCGECSRKETENSHAPVNNSNLSGDSSERADSEAGDCEQGIVEGVEHFTTENNSNSDFKGNQGLEPCMSSEKSSTNSCNPGKVSDASAQPATDAKDDLDTPAALQSSEQESRSTGIESQSKTGNVPVGECNAKEEVTSSGMHSSVSGMGESNSRPHSHHGVPPVVFPPPIDEVDETEEDGGDAAQAPGEAQQASPASPVKSTGTKPDGSKPDSKSYFAKSMLPGLSSLRHSSHNSKNTSNSSKNSSNSKNASDSSKSASNASKNTSNSSKSASDSSKNDLSASGSTQTVRTSSGDPAPPEHRLSSVSTPDDITWQPKRLSAHRQLSSSDSWGSDDFESYSSNDEAGEAQLKGEAARQLTGGGDGSLSGSVPSVGVAGRSERLKARLLRKREHWRERRQSSGRDVTKAPPSAARRDSGDPHDSPAAVDGTAEDASSGGGKLSRWFSLRKSANSEAGDRKTSTSGAGTPAPQSGGGNPLAGGKGTVPSYGKAGTAAREPCDETDAVSNESVPQHHRNSSTLSTASFSSSSSSSTTSSSSSVPPTTPSTNPNSQPNNPKLPQLTEMEERMSELDAGTAASNFYLHSCGGLGALGANTFQRKHQPPSLPPMPPGLTPEQIKRRHIVTSIVHSENNYVATLHRLVREYRKPLEEAKPPILSQSKIAVLFHYVHELLQCHTLFRIALTDCVRHWDRDEKIGDVFFACFSKSVVLEIYSEFINNFTRAMELAKLESRKKSIFADFLKMRQITSPDRLSFFGMMVKPVQRFPQFILFLQDLLKHTPKGHPDRMSLQLALTQLESLAETLNELKRESEQHQAFKATLKQINSKFALRNISEGNRCLIRQDDATKLEFGPNGLIKQTKERRLFLTTDAVICVSVVPKTSDDVNSHERLSLKWVHPITEIEVQESNSSLTLSRLLAAGLAQRTSGNSTSSLGKTTSPGGASSVYDIYNSGTSTNSLMESEAMVGAICAEMNDLMHDYEVVSRIAGLVSTLKGSYDALSASTTQSVLDVIQQNIQARDDRMSWLDGCCLQIRAGKDVMTFHVQDPGVKKDWIIELRLAQLAVSSVNSPAWDTGDSDSQRPPSRRPLFVTALPLLHASHHTQVVCGCQYPLLEVPKNVSLKSVMAGTRRRRGKTSTSVWICSTDGVTSYVTRYVTHLGGLRECGRTSLHELCVTGMLHVPPSPLPPPTPSPLITPTSPAPSPHPLLSDRSQPAPLTLDTVWIGTLQNRLLVYSGSAHDAQEELYNTGLPAAVSSLIYHCHMVFVGLTNGSLLVFHRSATDGCWQLSAPDSLELSTGAPVSALLPLSAQLYAAVADSVVVVDCATLTVVKRLSAHHGGRVAFLAHSGIGLWLSEEGSSTVCLYHTESCRHLQDIDLAPSVSRMLGLAASACSVVVTSLVNSRGLLWVGTSLGVTVTLPLPRLQGVPIISGRPTLSCHAHTGPVTFLMTLMTPEYYTLPRRKAGSVPPEAITPEKTVDWESDVSKTPEGDSSTGGAKQASVKRAHTLPRGFGASPGVGLVEDMGANAPGDEGAVLGLCGDLLRHWNDEDATGEGAEGQEDDLRRSDPSLSSMGSTLDRRLRLRDGRPRSLDLSSASIDSKISALTTTSSGSDDSSTLHTARQSTIREDGDVELENANKSLNTSDVAGDNNIVQSGSAVPEESNLDTSSVTEHNNVVQSSAADSGDRSLDTRPTSDSEQTDSNLVCTGDDPHDESIQVVSSNKPDQNTRIVESHDEVDLDAERREMHFERETHLETNSVEEKSATPGNDESEKIASTVNNVSVTQTTTDSSTGNLAVRASIKKLNDSNNSEEILHSNAGENTSDEKKNDAGDASNEENTSGVGTEPLASDCSDVNSNLKIDKDLPTASVDETSMSESPARTSSVARGNDLAESLKSASDAARGAVSLTTSVEDVTAPKEVRRRTHRRSSSDVTLPVSDAPPAANRPKISLPAGPVSTVGPETQNREEIRLSPKTPGKGSDRFNAPYAGSSINRSLGTLSRSPTARSVSKSAGGAETCAVEQEQPRTVLVLTGGRGYKCIRDTAPTNGPPHNNTDAHILVWEMKL